MFWTIDIIVRIFIGHVIKNSSANNAKCLVYFILMVGLQMRDIPTFKTGSKNNPFLFYQSSLRAMLAHPASTRAMLSWVFQTRRLPKKGPIFLKSIQQENLSASLGLKSSRSLRSGRLWVRIPPFLMRGWIWFCRFDHICHPETQNCIKSPHWFC